MRFKGKVVLVTGASRGIGRAIALCFGKEGASVVVNYTASEDKAKIVASEIEKSGGKAITIKCDVSDEAQVKKMVAETIKKFGRIDVLVNNAGIVFDLPFIERTTEHWKKTLAVDLDGVYFCCKYASEQMKKQKSGRIINISSTSGVNTYDPMSIDYAAAKAGVIMFTKALAMELGRYNILVNVVAPGWVNTDLNAKLPKEFIKKETEKIFIKRFCDPEEIAKPVLFLASDDASYINGDVLMIDGGYR